MQFEGMWLAAETKAHGARFERQIQKALKPSSFATFYPVISGRRQLGMNLCAQEKPVVLCGSLVGSLASGLSASLRWQPSPRCLSMSSGMYQFPDFEPLSNSDQS
jgi:hypothetical protein